MTSTESHISMRSAPVGKNRRSLVRFSAPSPNIEGGTKPTDSDSNGNIF